MNEAMSIHLFTNYTKSTFFENTHDEEHHNVNM